MRSRTSWIAGTVLAVGIAAGAAADEASERAEDREAVVAAHLELLQERLPGPGFTVIRQDPFVVVGDEAPAVVKGRAIRTVKWAVDHLKKLYFKKDPAEVITIWLFKNKTSYEANVTKLFGEKPDTPFGYYTARHQALVMNIATGGGTLVHEIVHPFVRTNFPACPSWFNEGLASLYEQCGEREGKLAGFTNWRLRGLKQAIEAKTLPSFEELSSTSDHQFYEQDRGDNYAQARYLCYYLQQKGLLVRFFERFRATCVDDPTGFEALKHVLGRDDMDAFQQEWEAWVKQLKFG